MRTRVLLIGTLLALLAAPQVSAQQTITLLPATVSGITNTTTTVKVALLPNCNVLDVLLNITGIGAATGTLQVFLEDSADGGTTWDDVIASNAFTFGAAAVTQHFFLNGLIATTATSGAAAAVETLAAGTTRQGPFGDRLRIREKVSGVSGSPTGVTYAIAGVCKP
jgi:hypothetical protein